MSGNNDNNMSLAEVAEEQGFLAGRMKELTAEVVGKTNEEVEPTDNDELAEAFDDAPSVVVKREEHPAMETTSNSTDENVPEAVETQDVYPEPQVHQELTERRVQVVEQAPVEKPQTKVVVKATPKVAEIDLDAIPVTSKKFNLKKVAKAHITSGFNVICGHSAYPATMKAINLSTKNKVLSNSDNSYQFRLKIVQAIYNCIENMGVNKPAFDTWAKMTANVDIPTLLFGMYASTYPKESKTKVLCQGTKCKKELDLRFKPVDVIQVKDAEIFETIEKVNMSDINNKFIQDNSEVLKTTRMAFDKNTLIAEVYHAASISVLLNALKTFKQSDYENNAEIIGTMLSIKKLYVKDPDGEGFFEIDNIKDIYEFMLSDMMSPEVADDIDLKVNGFIKQRQIEYRVPAYDCPHCGHHHDGFPMDIEKTLFSKMQGVI